MELVTKQNEYTLRGPLNEGQVTWGHHSKVMKSQGYLTHFRWGCEYILISIPKCWKCIPKRIQKPWVWIHKPTFRPFFENLRPIITPKSPKRIPIFISKWQKVHHLGHPKFECNPPRNKVSHFHFVWFEQGSLLYAETM